jgi:transposase-like protein
VARDLGIGNETLRRWVIQAEVDAGETEDLTSDEWAELVMLWRQRGHPAERRSHQTSRSCGPYPAQDHPLP